MVAKKNEKIVNTAMDAALIFNLGKNLDLGVDGAEVGIAGRSQNVVRTTRRLRP